MTYWATVSAVMIGIALYKLVLAVFKAAAEVLRVVLFT